MQVDLFLILSVFAFALGACIASFLNVVIWRVPRGESIVSPPSHCPKCNAAIRWYQNIPILSWLALRGRCANCREPISPRYLLVELTGGLLFFAVFAHYFEPYWWSWVFIPKNWIWVSLMLAGSMIDFDHKLLPDFTTVGGMVLGLATAAGLSIAYGWNFRPLLVSAGGLVFGFGLLWLVRFFGSKAFKREAMGMGDVFLMGAVGAVHGPSAVLFTLIFSSVFGSVFGVLGITLSKSRFARFTEIPYGPYICMADLLYMFCGQSIITAYLKTLGAA